ncbi:arginine-specific demethylase JMJ20 isoform X2 [Aristolochia californica]|uniref:arginine-specific demethylase JMJ20 isoform X2 n=1 Tax=Aristolochia californica TaxID=171875 RepID=UPI0035E0A9E8
MRMRVTGTFEEVHISRDWVTEDGKPNFHFLSTHFGSSMIQVAECGRREFTDQKRVQMSVKEFIIHWLELSTRKCSNSVNYNSKNQDLLYLKDWHFVKEYPNFVAYSTPPFFVDDWLNLYLDTHKMHEDPHTCRDINEINCSDYRFVYMGPKGTWTPLHADVFRSYSWSANVCGRKQWHFLSPSQCHLLFDRNMKNSVYDIFEDVVEVQFPGFKKAIWLECTQEQNEVIFVPSGWYHQVQNMEDTISINHNWFNAYNLSWVWNLLLKDYNEAKEYIEDIRDICDNFEGLCQRNLAANTGMNFFDFFTFITRISFANLVLVYHLLQNERSRCGTGSRRAQHHITNLKSVHVVASKMISVDAFTEKNLHCSLEEDQFSSIEIRKMLTEPEFIELCSKLNGTYEATNAGQGAGIRNSDADMEDHQLIQFLKSDLLDSDFVNAFGFKISHPKELIKAINNAIKYLNVIAPWDVGFFPE